MQQDWDRFYDCLISVGRTSLYVRQIDIEKLEEKYDWEFRTKHQLGVELMTWLDTLVELICWDVEKSELTDRSHRLG